MCVTASGVTVRQQGVFTEMVPRIPSEWRLPPSQWYYHHYFWLLKKKENKETPFFALSVPSEGSELAPAWPVCVPHWEKDSVSCGIKSFSPAWHAQGQSRREGMQKPSKTHLANFWMFVSGSIVFLRLFPLGLCGRQEDSLSSEPGS